MAKQPVYFKKGKVSMENASRRQTFQIKKNWSNLPWSEAESSLSLNQNCVFKTATRKDFFHRKKLHSWFQKDVRCDLLTIRRYSERKRPGLMFQKIIHRPSSHFNSFFFEFLKFKILSSSQKFKLAKIISDNSFFEKGFFQTKNLFSLLESFFLEGNDLFPQKIYKREKMFFFYLKKLFEVFPTQGSFQAFQFYWILFLSMEEKSQYFFGPESESLVEPNVYLPRSLSGSQQSRLEYQPLHCFKDFIESFFFRSHIKKTSSKFYFAAENKSLNLKQTQNFHSNEPLFLMGSLNSKKFSLFEEKLETLKSFFPLFQTNSLNLFGEITFYGLERLRGFFFDILSEKKDFKQKTGLLQPFFLSGLDFDIKKWEQSKKTLSSSMKTQKSSFYWLEQMKNGGENTPLIGKSLRKNHKKENIRQPAASFFLLGSEEEFIVFNKSEKNLVNSLKFLKDWIFLSFANISINFLDLSNLKTGIEFQNHSLKRMKSSSLTISTFSKQETLEIVPSKSYQNRFLKYIKKILIISRGKSSGFLIRSLNLLLLFWRYSIFFNGDVTSIRKIFRKIDSFLHFQILKWARRNHPNWSQQKIVSRYFPKGKVWNYKRKAKKENWVFSDKDEKGTLLFLPKLSWLEREEFFRPPFPQIIFSGVFHKKMF
jgi:hypothetical protein